MACGRWNKIGHTDISRMSMLNPNIVAFMVFEITRYQWNSIFHKDFNYFK